MSLRYPRVALAAFGAVALAITGCSSSGSGSPSSSSSAGAGAGKVKVALVLPCEINDLTWCQVAYDAAKRLQSEGLIDLEYTTNAPQDTAGITPILAQYAQKGDKLVIAHSTWQDAVLDVAKKFPNTDFVDSFGSTTAQNVGTYNNPIYEPAYLAGIVAGGVTKTGVIGGIGAQKTVACEGMLNAFLNGAKKVNPKVRELFTYTGDWNDAGAAKQATTTQASQHADVFTACGNGPSEGMISAIKGTKLYGFSYIGDQSSLAPQNVLGSLVYNLYPYFKEMVQDVRSGHFNPGKAYNLTYAQDAFIFKINDALSSVIPSSVMTTEKAAEQQIKDGSLTVSQTAQ